MLKVNAYLDSRGQTTKNQVKNLGVILETDLSISHQSSGPYTGFQLHLGLILIIFFSFINHSMAVFPLPLYFKELSYNISSMCNCNIKSPLFSKQIRFLKFSLIKR